MRGRHLRRIVALWVICALSVVLVTPVAFSRAKFPRASDYLTEKNVSPIIFQRAKLPDDYLFPNDWVKQQDWDAIKKRFGGTTITMMTEGTDIQAPQMFAEHFEELSGIRVNIEGIPPENLFEKLLVALASGTGAYDVIEYYSVNLPAFARFLTPLEPYIERWKYDWNDWLPVWQEAVTYNDKVLSLPYDCDMQFFLSRAKFLKQIGVGKPPETWDEVLTYSQKLKNVLPAGVYPIGFMASRSFFDLETYWNIAAPFGADMLKPGTWEPAMNSPEGVQALEFLKKLIDEYGAPGSTNWGYTEHLEAWNAGQMAMTIQYPNQESYNPQMSRIAAEERWHSIIPKGPGPKGRFAPEGTYTTSILGILENSRKKDAAFLWISFLSSAEVSFIYTIAGTGMDFGRKSVFDHPITPKLYPNTQAWLDSAPYAYFFPRIPETPELVTVHAAYVHDALTGRMSAKEALDRSARDWRRILERGGYFGPNAPPPQYLWLPDALRH